MANTAPSRRWTREGVTVFVWVTGVATMAILLMKDLLLALLVR